MVELGETRSLRFFSVPMANGIGVFLVLSRFSNEEGLGVVGVDLIRV